MMQTIPSSTQTRIKWLDAVRALGSFLVVLAHVQYTTNGPDLAGVFYYAVSRVAVPLFFMASGFLLLSKSDSYADFFRKRALKVFVPFLIWSVIYLLWKGESLDQPFLTIIKSYFVKILRGPRENHLWFFYELFGLYLFTPILRIFVQKASQRDLYYFCGIWFLLVPLVNLVEEFTPIQIGFEYRFLGGYIGYFIFGYLVGNMQFSRRQKIVALALFLASLVATTASMYLSDIHGLKTQYFEDYLSVNVVLMSASLLIALAELQISDPAYRLIDPLSRASFGVYLVHVIVMVELFSGTSLSILTKTGSAIYMIPVLGTIGFVVSFLLIFILQKIPLLKQVVP